MSPTSDKEAETRNMQLNLSSPYANHETMWVSGGIATLILNLEDGSGKSVSRPGCLPRLREPSITIE
jgi:hypothetical protein